MANRSSLLCSMLLVLACTPKASDIVGDTENGSEDGDGDATPDDDDDDDDGASGGVQPDAGGGMVVDGFVDCATVSPTGPTVAGGEIGPTGFPEYACNPRVDGGLHANGYQCCSVDPAAEGGGLPNYVQKEIVGGGNPYFSGDNNDFSAWGMCVRTSDIPAGAGLLEAGALNCPVPCNPTWDEDSIDVVCGETRMCCQTHELTANDCVQDDDGTWRPVAGEDIGDKTDWNAATHDTHQDPNGVACTAFASGDQTSDTFLACIAELSVADQRGVCMALSPGQQCPAAQPTYVNACELLNQ